MSLFHQRAMDARTQGVCRLLAAVVCVAGFSAPLLAAESAGTKWIDPIDSPAVMSPLAAKTQLLSVAQAGHRLVAAGWRGHILVSDDGGATWKQVPSPVSIDLNSVFFVSPDTGWAVGHGGVILRTDNGGLAWAMQEDGRVTARTMLAYYEKQVAAGVVGADKLLETVKLNTQSGADQPWHDVHFIDASTGWVCGAFGMLMGTTDGGRHWTPWLEHIDNPDALHLTAMADNGDGDIYIASEKGTVFHKGRGDDKFTPIKTGYTGTFFGVMARGKTVIAYGLRGTAYRSDDAGGAWRALSTGTAGILTAGAMLPDGRVLLASEIGELLVARPGSESFTPIQPKQRFLFAGIAALKADSVVIVGTGGAFAQPLK